MTVCSVKLENEILFLFSGESILNEVSSSLFLFLSILLLIEAEILLLIPLSRSLFWFLHGRDLSTVSICIFVEIR